MLWSNWSFNNFFNRLRFRDRIIVRHYDLVFDGFPRSSNTYGGFMFLVTQQDRFKVLTHIHRPSIFYRAAQLGKPACLTLRDPVEAVASWVTYTGFSVKKVTDYYIFFYEVLLPIRSQLVVLPFPLIVEDFETVLRLISLRFGLELATDFDPVAGKEEAFRRIEQLFTGKDGAVDPLRVARPEQARAKRNAEVCQELLLPRHAARLERCRELYSIYEAEYRRDRDRLPRRAVGRTGPATDLPQPSGLSS